MTNSNSPFSGNGHEKSLYINTDTFRKSDKKRASVESENLNSDTFEKTSKPKRVESFIKRLDVSSIWRRNKDKSPSPVGTDTIKRSKNLFNLMASGKKSTRDIGIECKMDEDRDYYSGMGTRKTSVQSLLSEKKYRPRSSLRDHGSSQQLTGIIKPPERRYPYKSSTPATAPIRVELDVRNTRYSSESELKPVGIASPLPQARSRSVLKNVTASSYEKKPSELPRSYVPVRKQETANNFNREGSERLSFRQHRERLRGKNENRRITDNSDDELRKSYQRSFFVPM